MFVTADAVTIQSGHVLLVRRGQQPGKGQLAIPGGYVNQNERIRTAAVRELKEETAIKDGKGEIPPAMLNPSSIDTAARVRRAASLGARPHHHPCFSVSLPPDRRSLFTVKGSDDAHSAAWYRLGDLARAVF